MSMTKIEVMQAFENGLQIERRRTNTPDFFPWHDDPDPLWNWEKFHYRVKKNLPLEIRIIYSGDGDSFEVNAENVSILEMLKCKRNTKFIEVIE